MCRVGRLWPVLVFSWFGIFVGVVIVVCGSVWGLKPLKWSEVGLEVRVGHVVVR